MRRRLLIVFFVTLWLSMVAVGTAFVWSHNQTPGVAAEAPVRWPSASIIPRRANEYTLVMLAHPKCPCTRASIEELSKLMTDTRGRLSAYVLLLKPHGFAEDWYRTDLWQNAERIPGVSVLVDEDGIEAARFGAATSGQVLVYDANSTLKFRGGITASRGHSGDNAGRSAIEALVNKGASDRESTFVFGCPLFDPNSECRTPNHEKISK